MYVYHLFVVTSARYQYFPLCALSTTSSCAAGGKWRLQYVVNLLLLYSTSCEMHCTITVSCAISAFALHRVMLCT